MASLLDESISKKAIPLLLSTGVSDLTCSKVGWIPLISNSYYPTTLDGWIVLTVSQKIEQFNWIKIHLGGGGYNVVSLKEIEKHTTKGE